MPGKPNLLPKEHGAYAELAFPLVTGLGLAAPSFPSMALGTAAVFFFLAHEPLAVVLGARGTRIRDQLGARARTRGKLLLGCGLILGAAGILSAGPAVWPWILAPLSAGGLLVPLVLAGRQKSFLGEMTVVTAFSALPLPLAVASGVPPGTACFAGGVWWGSFILGTLEVHAIKVRHKDRGRSSWTRWASPWAAGLTAAGALGLVLAGRGLVPVPWALAVFPPAAAVFVLSLLRVHPRSLKRVGWLLVGANCLSLLVLLLG